MTTKRIHLRYLLDVGPGPGAASVQKRLLRQRVNCCVAASRSGWRAASSPQVRPPRVGSGGGAAPEGVAGASRPAVSAGACLLGRGPLGGVALRALPAGVRVRGGRGGRGFRVPTGPRPPQKIGSKNLFSAQNPSHDIEFSDQKPFLLPIRSLQSEKQRRALRSPLLRTTHRHLGTL